MERSRSRERNRHLFEDALVRQIRHALKKCDGTFTVYKEQGRIFVNCEGEYDYEETVGHLQHVFGIVGICPVSRRRIRELRHLETMC